MKTQHTKRMHYFYVLYSLKDHRLYKGYTSNLGQRFCQHINGQVKSTRHRRPFVILHVEQYESKSGAMRRERICKTLEGGNALRQLLIEKDLMSEVGHIK